MKKHIVGRTQAFWIIGIAILIVIGVIVFRRWKPDQYIIGEITYISSAGASMENFDKRDGAYTGDPTKLFITFIESDCEFLDENGKVITALDITIGSKVKMTSTTGLKTNAEGYTTVEIKKVEVLQMAQTAEDFFQSNQSEEEVVESQGDQFIVGEITIINSAGASMNNFDPNESAYTGDPEKLFIDFLDPGCEFLDESGKAITAQDITVGSKVKMTVSSGLDGNTEGNTTVEIKKVEVLKMA